MEEEKARATVSTRGMVQKLNETKDIAVRTLESLNSQGETMDRIQSLNEVHTATLKQADRFSNLFKKKQKKHKDIKKAKEESSTDHLGKIPVEGYPRSDSSKENSPTSSNAENLTEEDRIWHPEKRQQIRETFEHDPEILANMTAEQRNTLQEQDRDLDLIKSVLGDLKHIGLRANNELQSQSAKIDNLHDQVDKNNYILEKSNTQLRAKNR